MLTEKFKHMHKPHCTTTVNYRQACAPKLCHSGLLRFTWPEGLASARCRTTEVISAGRSLSLATVSALSLAALKMTLLNSRELFLLSPTQNVSWLLAAPVHK